MMISNQIKKLIQNSLEHLNLSVSEEDIVVEQSNTLDNGDYTTNIAMRMASVNKSNPRELAQKIVDTLEQDWQIEKVEIAGPGFINFFLSNQYLQKKMKEILDLGGIEYLKSNTKDGKKILVEYTDPNPFKMMHVGHLYTNIVGESFARLQESTGADVKRANYQGDVGLHVGKTMWGIEKIVNDEGKSFEEISKLSLFEKVDWLGRAYQLGSEYYDDIKDPDAISRIEDLNYYIYQISYPSIPKKDFKEFDDIGIDIWFKDGREWCLDYFETVYEKLGTKFDYYFLEGTVGEVGYSMVMQNIDTVFKKDDGAVIYQGDPEKGLHTRVFINQAGLPTYEAKELGLAKAKSDKMDWDESITITGSEQSGYFKVVSDAISRLLPEYAKVFSHIPHGMIRLPGMKKMSSRRGSIIAAEDLLNIAKDSVRNLMNSNSEIGDEELENLAQKISISAIKYAFLRVSVGKDIIFDLEKDIQFDGDTGPYLMYVYTRALSIIQNCDLRYDSSVCIEGCLSNPSVKKLVREISKAKDVVLNASTSYSPNILCTYLFELGQSFNRFYQEVNVLNAQEEDQKFLLSIVESTAEIMNAGLNLLGIATVTRM